MDIFNDFKLSIENILKKLPMKSKTPLDLSLIKVEQPKDPKFGDISTNVAMVLSKAYDLSTFDLAHNIADLLLKFEADNIADVNLVKPGFINITLKPKYWHKLLNQALIKGNKLGYENLGEGKKINIEYVSANPTGPLHIGHGRGAVIGDILANLYDFMGYQVTKEYYINDAGNQVEGLGKSVYFRYCEELGLDADKPEDFYPAEYVRDIAKKIIKNDDKKWLNSDKSEAVAYFKDIAIAENMQSIKQDLQLLGINHDLFSSERAIATDELYGKLESELTKQNLIYIGTLPKPKGVKLTKEEEQEEARNQKLFKTSDFGDDIDRALEKKDGSRTYFASDILYHYNKYQRGFNKMIDILGVDHKGYKKRLVASVSAISAKEADLEIVFTELVNLLKEGKPVKMSKRAGNFVTLREVLEEINSDVFRFLMISRSDESLLDIELDNLAEKNDKNPVYYVQYAYARINSVVSKAKEEYKEVDDLKFLINLNKDALKHKDEINVIKALSLYPKYLKNALQNNNVHLLYLILVIIAKSIHTLWSSGKTDKDLRFIIEGNKNLTLTRLSLLVATQKIMLALFKVIGISNPERM
ncbi:arginine--tRNA ligase [Rickettsiales bacterium LUAb2]